MALISSSLPQSFFFCIILTIIISKNIVAPAVHAQCLEDQKTLLLELKSELKFHPDYSQKLARWNQTHDCCSWDGVECDGAGLVIGLQLDSEGIAGGLNESSSLFRLRYLEKLNLANNDFTTQKIPKAIHHLTHLTHLNLFNAGFVGHVPIELSLLRRLVVLDISTWFLNQTLEILNLKILIRNLTSLREVYLDGADISGAGSEWCQAISSSLPHLRVLSLIDCKLSGPFCPSLSQLHSLSVVQLDSNNLSTTIPDSVANFSSLTTFRCSECSLIGSIPKMILQGISISSASLGGENFLITFGGYNGKYYNEVFALRVKPRDSLHPKILQSPAAAAAAASVSAAYALARPELLGFSEKEDLNSKIIPVDTSQQDLSAEINSIKEEKKALELSISEITSENSGIKTKIEETNGNYAELSKELHSVQGQLVQERSRCANLEAQIAELQKVLESLPSLEEEVQALRREKSAFERDMEHAEVQKQRSGGIWKWVAG